jgi:hypothetical protein
LNRGFLHTLANPSKANLAKSLTNFCLIVRYDDGYSSLGQSLGRLNYVSQQD